MRRNHFKKDAVLVATTSKNPHKRMVAYNNRAKMKETVTLEVNPTYVEDITPPELLKKLQEQRGVKYFVTTFGKRKECSPYEAAMYLKGGIRVEIV